MSGLPQICFTQVTCAFPLSCTPSLITSPQYLVSRFPHFHGQILTAKPSQAKPSQAKPSPPVVKDLLDAVMLPEQIAICKRAAHTPETDPV